jgi:hypothetical protein
MSKRTDASSSSTLAERLRALELEHHVSRGELFRQALEQAGWLEQAAAGLLEIPRSTFKRQLWEKYPDLAKEAAAARAAMGYTTGNPELWAKKRESA